MSSKIKGLITSLGLTIMLYLFLEILNTSLIPVILPGRFRLNFDILFVLFICFKIQSDWTAVYILLIEFLHSAFTIQGWAHGTLTGVIVSIVANTFKDVVQFSSYISTVVVVELFHILWGLILILLYYIQSEGDFHIWGRLLQLLGESTLLALISPFFFAILDRIWQARSGEALEA